MQLNKKHRNSNGTMCNCTPGVQRAQIGPSSNVCNLSESPLLLVPPLLHVLCATAHLRGSFLSLLWISQ